MPTIKSYKSQNILQKSKKRKSKKYHNSQKIARKLKKYHKSQKTKSKNTAIAKKMPQKSKKYHQSQKNTTKVKSYHNNATILKIYHKLKKIPS